MEVKKLRASLNEQIGKMQTVPSYNPHIIRQYVGNTTDEDLFNVITDHVLKEDTSGFTSLLLADRLEYTIEYMIAKKFKDDFSEEVLAKCKERLGDKFPI